MDEPTNHLDLESIMMLEQFLKSFQGALLMTSQTRVMNRLVSKIAKSNRRDHQLLGNYDFYERERNIRAANQQAAFSRSIHAGQGAALH